MSHSRLQLKPVAVKLWEQHIWIRSSREIFPFVVRTCEGDKGDSLSSSLWKPGIISLWKFISHLWSPPASQASCFHGCILDGNGGKWSPVVAVRWLEDLSLSSTQVPPCPFAVIKLLLDLDWQYWSLGLGSWIQPLKTIKACSQDWH